MNLIFRNPTRKDRILICYLWILGIIGVTVFSARAWFLDHPIMHVALSGGYTSILTSGAWSKESGFNLFTIALIGTLGSLKGTPAFYLAGRWWGREYLSSQFRSSKLVKRVVEIIEEAETWKLLLFIFIGHIPGLNVIGVPANIIAGIKKTNIILLILFNFLGLFMVNVGLAYIGYRNSETIMEIVNLIKNYAILSTIIFSVVAALGLTIRMRKKS